MLTTFRLSPKHQVTIPVEGRSLLTADARVFHGVASHVPGASVGERWPILVLLSPAELARREAQIRADADKPALERDRLAMALRAQARAMALDDQHRVVLPEPFVRHLDLQRDIFFIPLNDSLRVWNPEHYRRFARLDESLVDPSLADYLLA